MNRALLLLLTLLILTVMNIFASPYDMILVGDPVIEDIRFLSLESGRSFLSFTPPFAPHEVENFINRIDTETLSPPAREAYNRIRKRLTPSAPLSLVWHNFSFFLNVNTTVEFKARFNNDIDWRPEYARAPSMLSVPFRFFFSDSLMLYFDPAVSIDLQDYYTNNHFSNNLVFFGGNNIHGNSPFRTFIAIGGSWWNFQLGRDRLSTGTGISGNLSISDNPPFYEFMRVSFFSDYLKYSLTVNQNPLRVNKALYPNVDDNDERMRMTTQRHFYLHRVDFNIFNILSVGISEGVMAGNSALELRYLNPLMIIHNAMTWRDYDIWAGFDDGHMNGHFFTAEINWNIIKSLSAYGQFSMTQLAVGPEYGREDEYPNAIGLMFGLQYSRSIKSWGSIFYLEWILTSPFLYINQSPFASLIYMHSHLFVSEKMYYYYFSYPRDTLSVSAGARFFNGTTLDIKGEFSWIARGEHGGNLIVWDLEKDHSWAPSGIPENNFILSVGADWKLFSFLTFSVSIIGIYSQNRNNIKGSNEIGGQVSVSVNFYY
ncbi:MAG: hypothetical protein FWB86_01215 [Treponema sp.]|nr:hypothetical protein [Treponema sp.]MCL2250396.1 hypothetical protein [Treponema sp.]